MPSNADSKRLAFSMQLTPTRLEFHFIPSCRYLRSRVPPSPFQFAISASFTAEPIQPIIDFWGRRLNAEFEIRFAPYNQILQTLLDPHSVFAGNQHGIDILLVRLEDLGEPERMEVHANELVHLVRDSAVRFS